MTKVDHLWAGWRSEYIAGVNSRTAPDDCFFCALQGLDDVEAMILERTATTFTLMNAYPYTSGHLLIAPLRHESTLVGLDAAEAAGLMAAIQRANEAIVAAYQPGGLNVGANIGARPAPACPATSTCTPCRAGTATRTS